MAQQIVRSRGGSIAISVVRPSSRDGLLWVSNSLAARPVVWRGRESYVRESQKGFLCFTKPRRLRRHRHTQTRMRRKAVVVYLEGASRISVLDARTNNWQPTISGSSAPIK